MMDMKYGKQDTLGLSQLITSALDHRWDHARQPNIVGYDAGVVMLWPKAVNDCGCHLMLVLKNGDEILYHGGHECGRANVDYDKFNLTGSEKLTAYFVEYDEQCGFLKHHDEFVVDLSLFENARRDAVSFADLAGKLADLDENHPNN